MNGADRITSCFSECPVIPIQFTGKQRPGGYLHLEDGKIHMIRIELKDAYGNISNLEFKVRYQPDRKQAHAIYAGKIFYPGMLDGFEAPNAAFYLGQTCLYDSLHLDYWRQLRTADKNLVSAIHHFGNTQVPLADTMTVRIRLTKSESQKDHILMSGQIERISK